MSGIQTRAELTEQANKLGIPWTNDSSDAEISALIAARENGNMAAPATEKNPECFGLMWDPLKEEQCQGCTVQGPCLDKLIKGALPDTIKSLGKNPALPVIASTLGVSIEAAAAAIEKMQAGSGGKLMQLKQPAPLAPVAAPAAEPSVTAPPLAGPPPVITEAPMIAQTPIELPAVVASPVEKSGKKEAAAIKKAEALAAKAAKAQAEAERQAAYEKEKADKKAEKEAAKEAEKAAKKAAKEAKKAEAVAEKEAAPVAENPTVAAPASLAGDAAKAPKAKSAAPAAAREDRRIEDPWGKHTFAARFENEKERSPQVAKLKTGQVLTRQFDGKTYKVTVCKDHYQYAGQSWPTLYIVTKEITGTVERTKQLVEGKRPAGSRPLCNWSAPRFWRLRDGKQVEERVRLQGPASSKPKAVAKTKVGKPKAAKRQPKAKPVKKKK